MIRQINPITHPWLHKLARLYKPYSVAANHSIFHCQLAYRECELCRLEATRYFIPDDAEFYALSPAVRKDVLTR
jgi:hypothetical protein